MDRIKQYLSAGQLQAAIDHLQQALRQKPAAHDLRACLVELLCIDGQLERADDLLSTLARQQPDWLPGLANLRQLLRAQQARLALRQGKLADGVVAQAGPSLEALLALNLCLSSDSLPANKENNKCLSPDNSSDNNECLSPDNPDNTEDNKVCLSQSDESPLDEASRAAGVLEAERQPCRFQADGEAGEIRDCDDSLNGYLEGLGTDGCYYLWQWSEIEAIEFHAPGTPVELVWRRATVDTADGRQGEVFIPLTYVASVTDAQKLGRETDWVQVTPALVTGVGQKLFLVGEAAVALGELNRIERLAEKEASNAV